MDLRIHFNNIVLLKTFFGNFKGLMFKKRIASTDCYILETNGIHTFFMKFSLDVIYLNKDKKVIRKFKEMKPGRIGPVDFKCKYVLEFSNNNVMDEISIGDLIKY